MDETESLLIPTGRSAELRPPLSVKEQMIMKMIFVLVMQESAKQQQYAGRRHSDRTHGVLFTVLRPPCVSNPSSSEDILEMDGDWNTICYGSVMIYVYDVH